MSSVMSKKEFKNKCKTEKTKTYKLKRLSTILTCVGFAIVALTYVIALKSNFTDMNIFIGFFLGVPFAIVGAVLDVISDLKFNKEYKEYKQSGASIK